MRDSDPPTSPSLDRLFDGLSLLRAISDTLEDVIFAKDRAGRLRFANPATLALIGKPLEQVLGKTDLELLENPGAARVVMENDRRIMESGVPEDLEEVVPLPDGTARVWLSRKVPYRDAGGDVVGLLGISRDITERKRTQVALRESEERYRALFTHMTEGFALGEAIVDDAGAPCDVRFLEMNEAFERHTGLDREAIRGRPLREVLPSVESHWIDLYCSVATTGAPRRLQEYNRDLDRHFSVFSYSPAPGRFATLFTDVTERERAHAERRTALEALNLERDKLAAVIGALPVGVGIADGRGTTLSMNAAALALHGFRSQAEMLAELSRYAERFELRRPTGERLPLDEWPAARAMRGEPVSGYEVLLRNLEAGTERVVAYSAVPVRTGGGAVQLYVYVMQDVTDRRRDEAVLQRVNEELRESDRRKSEFLAVLSHELRNPLAPIRNGVHLLARAAPGSEQAARAREVIRRQTDHLARLVDDLLDVTRISRGRFELQRARVDLRDVVHRTADDLRALFEQGGIALRVDPGAEPAAVDVDVTRIAQALGNLLHNALKFTPPGGAVTVSLATAGGRAELRVVDTGRGMAPDEVERMFEPFAQGEIGLARASGGLGLGLPLVKGLVELHGGSVRARSEGPGRGAEFVIALPLSAGAAAAEARRGPAAGPGRLVLVIEDNADAGETLVDLLGLEGHRVHLARDGRSGLALARELVPDVVLCDIGLPDLDGYEVARLLRLDDVLRSTRLVALSGYAQPEDRARARRAGFDAHLAKPPEPEALFAAIAGPG